MRNLLYLAAGGILGTMARYFLTTWVQHRVGSDAFPAGTLTVNLIGCVVIGLVMGAWEGRAQEAMPQAIKLLVIVGFLGAFTTFSAFEMETVSLVQRGQILPALGYVLTSTVAGFAAVWFTFSWAAWFFSPQKYS